jgi:hypothetical protein
MFVTILDGRRTRLRQEQTTHQRNYNPITNHRRLAVLEGRRIEKTNASNTPISNPNTIQRPMLPDQNPTAAPTANPIPNPPAARSFANGMI